MQKQTTILAWVTSALVLLITLISFVISYNALRDLNQQYGISGQLAGFDLSYLWPLLIDFSLLVFSLCVVTAHLYSESTWRQWSLVAGYTIATIAVNTVHVWPELLPVTAIKVAIAVIPPVSLFFSFETLMGQLKASIKRQNQQQVATGYTAALQQAQAGFVELMQQVEDIKAQHIMATQAKDSQLAELQQRLEVALDPVTSRRNSILSLIQTHRAEFGTEPTQGYLAEQTGYSIATIRTDLKALNGAAQGVKL